MKITARGLLSPKHICLAILLVLSSSATLVAQTGARPDRGIMQGASYSVSDTENISLTNGNLNLSIPLASLPPIAGGKLKFSINAIYNSKLWNMKRVENRTSALEGCGQWVVDTPQVSDAGGWRIGTGYQIVFREAHDDFNYIIPQPYPPEDPCGIGLEDQLLLQERWYRTVLITPDGAEHELRPTDGYQPYTGWASSFLFNYYKHTPDLLGIPMRYYSFDGTYLWAEINPQSYATRWTIYLNDGTRITQNADGVQRIQDTNGNSVKTYYDEEGSHFQDEQTGREIKAVYDPAGNGGQGQTHISYQTVGGTWHNVDINYGTTRVQGKIYQVNGWSPTGGETGGGMVCKHHEELVTDLWVIREIVYPATEPGVPAKRYTFGYNSDTTETATDEVHWACGMGMTSYTRQASKGMGDLNRMVTPSGAIVDYAFSRDSTHYYLFDPDDIPRETITQKSVTHDGGTDVWNYNILEFGACGGTVTSPDGSVLSEGCFPHDTGAGSYFASLPKGGLVFATNNSNKTIVHRHWSLMKFTGANANATGNYGETTFNPVVDAEYTTLLDDTPSHNPIKMSAKTMQYDFNGNIVQETFYDWFDPSLVTRDEVGVPTGPPPGATVLRVVNNDYYNSSTNPGSGHVYAKRTIGSPTPTILNALQQTTLGPAITQLSYDGQAYGVAPSAGNLTSQSEWDNFDNRWITSSQVFGLYGNLATATDPRGKVTQFFYDDNTRALPNRIIVDPQNGTGTQTSTTVYDFYTGAVTSQTDANNQVASIDYTNQLLGTIDPFARPGITFAPAISGHRRRVTTFYEDSARRIRVESDLNTENDRLLKSQTTSDQLNRTILSEMSENGGTTYAVKSNTVYLQMGKVVLTSNPYRHPASTDGWTRITKDAVDRVVEVATFSGSAQPAATGYTNGTGKVSTSYDAEFTTVTDQAGNVRRSKTDGVGRIVRVDEPDATNNLGTTASPIQPTSYEYDILGNLKTVIQGTQTRTYNFDSLSRLRNAFNPESGTNTYVYDDNRNLTQKTDARGVVSTHAYDALNRATSHSYSDGTPTVTYTFDSVALNGKGRVGSVSSSVSSFSYSGYDATGKALGASQVIGSQTYTMGYGYDLAGNVKTMTYPSGRTVNYTYDATGRMSSFAGNLGEVAQRNYATGMVYDASGRLTQEQFGTTTALFNKLFYNTRGQLAEIRIGTTGNNTDWERGAIINHYSNGYGCWGASCNAPDNNGNLMKQEIHIPGQNMKWQQYDYDRLNRLTTVREVMNGNDQWRQTYTYDRHGNRRIDTNPSQTWGGVNNLGFELETASNRLYAPGDLALPDASRRMQYDQSGNLKTDTYTGQGQRTYDAENRMTGSTGVLPAIYKYDGEGRRINRIVSGVETWQVYGTGGELLAEYAQNAAAASPQKEYGYRNGKLLIIATAGTSWGSAPTFANNPLAVGTTTVQALHITQLRDAINDLRGHMSLADYTWAYSATTNDYISANPILEMRTALDQALGAPSPAYATGLVQGQLIKAVHIQELRDRLLTAWSSGTSLQINWLIADHLGTPRMIFDLTGSLASTRRHDYLPFGEELSTQSGRNSAQGYVADDTRQQFTSQERDDETGLDYFGARYYGSPLGRFTSPDDFLNDTHAIEPQSWNLYTYVRNNPLRHFDPDGRVKRDADGNVIFVTTASEDFPFLEKERVGSDGKTYKITVAWKVDKGYVTADDGTKIEAFKATGEITVTVKDSAGTVVATGGKEEVGKLFGQNGSTFSNKTDCHGTTFASGQVWINNNQVESLMKGDGYKSTKKPKAGDVGIYSTDGTLKPNSVKHSVLVDTIDPSNGQVAVVTSKGGITQKTDALPGPGVGTAWNDPNAKLRYYTKKAKK